MQEKYAGLFTCPAADVNFSSGIGRLGDEDLQAFYDALLEREEAEGGHKGRIGAVEKEIRHRQNVAAASPEIEAMALAAQSQKAELAATEEADKLYGDGQPYERIRLENEVRFYRDMAGRSFLEMGKRLILLKEHERGHFLKVLDNVDISARTASYAMEAARRFSKTPSIAALGTTKMIALTVLDDDAVQILEEGGEVFGMTVDDMSLMSSRELRENLRKKDEQLAKEKEGRKQDRETQEAVIAQKEKKINELEQQLRYLPTRTKEEEARAALAGLNETYKVAVAQISAAILNALSIVREAERIPGVDGLTLGGWLNQFEGSMADFFAHQKTWIDETDNARPIDAGVITDEALLNATRIG
jgi:hypothetical protein